MTTNAKVLEAARRAKRKREGKVMQPDQRELANLIYLEVSYQSDLMSPHTPNGFTRFAWYTGSRFLRLHPAFDRPVV